MDNEKAITVLKQIKERFKAEHRTNRGPVGLPPRVSNGDHTDQENPAHDHMPKHVPWAAAQTIAGTGYGPQIGGGL